MRKQPRDVGMSNNIGMVNYCYRIVKTYNGYITGIPITYSNDDFEEIIDVINYNDVTQEDTEYLKNALIYGRAFEVNYIDEDGMQRFRLFNTKECLPIYSNTLNGELLYVVRFYQESLLENQEGMDNYIVEVYGPSDVKKYRSAPGFASFELIDEYQHFYGQCPVTVFSLNEDEESIFNQVLTLQDNYNTVISNWVDDNGAWADAYLVLTGVAGTTNDDLMAMKETRTMMFDDASATADYLTKDSARTQTIELLKELNDQIHAISNCPNLLDEKFLAQSGEAIKYKLVSFETTASGIENNMRKALQRRVENISEIMSLTSDDQVWRDVDIRFTRNLPNSLTPTTVSELMQYKGLVSDRTLLEMVPFIKDPEAELKRVKEEQQEEIDLYEYGHQEANFADR